MRELALITVALLLLLGSASRAQAPSTSQSSPATMTGPAAGPSGGMSEQLPMRSPQLHPPWSRFHPRPPLPVRIVVFVLSALLALSGIFALTALGIFLIRRSRPSPRQSL